MFQIVSLSLVLFLVLPYLKGEDESGEEKTGVPIIRQINKVNLDGTYTYGYEAADGTFKIETRDVLGNIKGMFGFIDESGELKRVSYTANNETGFRNSVVHPPVATQGRLNPNSATRRPVLILKNTPALDSPTKGPVIQHIPKKTQKEDEEASTMGPDYVNARRFPSSDKNDTSEEHSDDSAKSNNANPLRKILVSKRPIDEKETRGKGGNNLRRQLSRALDLRGEMTHVYAGGDHGFSPNLPPHLSALMSELRPIQVVRAATPEGIGYQTVDVESASQEVNEVPATTTEPPYGSRKFVPPLTYVHPRYRRPVPPTEEPPYGPDAPLQYRHQNVQPAPQGPVPVSASVGIPLGVPNPNYQTHPHYYEQQPVSVIPPLLRDELMAIIYNYLQVRLGGNSQSPYYPRYPYPSYTNPLFTPNYPYTPINYGLHGLTPYFNPYVNSLPPYYQPYPNPNFYPVPTQTPLNQPNVQFSPRAEPPRRISPHRVPSVRAATDDADLLQMLLASPTRMPINQIKYSPNAERLNNPKVGAPVRSLQIIAETTESRPGTTESTE